MKSEAEIHGDFLAIAATLSPVLTEAIEQNGPIQLAADQTEPFPDRLCKAVTGQQLSTYAAASIWERLVAQANVDNPNGTLIDFFAAADTATLRGCGLSKAKIKTVGAIAQAAKTDQLNSQQLGPLTSPERTAILTKIWGIGQWTADMMNLFYFGDVDVWPEGDLAVRKTLTMLTSPRRKTIRTAERFAPYRSYLALHMWRYVHRSRNDSKD
ncbi:MAG: DNA-3-methyladenine glycosylase 2 family protein [Cyanobacteria bacterium J06649_4]